VTRCPKCGQHVQSEREKRSLDVFVWTLMSLCFWGAALSEAVWTLEWWGQRWQFVFLGVCLLAGAAYPWVRLLRERSRGRRDA
jgi:hypothetical protein